MEKPKLNILHLYPRDMNIYGDNGNVLTIQRRLKWRGIESEIYAYNPGDEFPSDIDIIIGGGGQDSGQSIVSKDLIYIGPKLIQLAEGGTPMLAVCGLYQLFGKFFKTVNGDLLPGIGLLDIETYGGSERLIGNIITESVIFGQIIGYENHSGLTYLGETIKPLGKVLKGAGNNLKDEYEGAMMNNVIGTYMHGSLLPKNPRIADFLIQKALENKYGSTINLEPMDDSLAEIARENAAKRPR